MHMSSSTAFFVFSRMFCFSKKGAVHGIRIRVPKTRHCGSLELRMTTCMSPNWSSLVLAGCSNIVSRNIHICQINTSLKHGSWHLGKIGVVHCNSAATWFCWDVTNRTTNQRKKRGSHKIWKNKWWESNGPPPTPKCHSPPQRNKGLRTPN